MKVEDFYSFVLPEVLGCPDPVMRQAVVQTAIAFCRETLAWSEMQDPQALVAGMPDYEIEIPNQAYAFTVRDVWLGAKRLRPVTMHALQDVMPAWATAQSNEPIYYNSAVERGVIRVFPMPIKESTGALTIRAAYTPIAAATVLPDFLGQRHMDVIASGAKGRLMLMPATAWANAALGEYYKKHFDDGVVNSRIEEAHERVPGTVSVQARSFGF